MQQKLWIVQLTSNSVERGMIEGEEVLVVIDGASESNQVLILVLMKSHLMQQALMLFPQTHLL